MVEKFFRDKSKPYGEDLELGDVKHLSQFDLSIVGPHRKAGKILHPWDRKTYYFTSYSEKNVSWGRRIPEVHSTCTLILIAKLKC